MVPLQRVRFGDQTLHVFCRRDGEITEVADDEEDKEDAAEGTAEDDPKEQDEEKRRDNVREADPGEITVERIEFDGDLNQGEGNENQNGAAGAVSEFVTKGSVIQHHERSDGDDGVEQAFPLCERHGGILRGQNMQAPDGAGALHGTLQNKGRRGNGAVPGAGAPCNAPHGRKVGQGAHLSLYKDIFRVGVLHLTQAPAADGDGVSVLHREHAVRESPDFVKIYDDTSGAGGEAGPAAEEVLDLVLRHIGPADFRGAGAVEVHIMIVVISVDDVAVRDPHAVRERKEAAGRLEVGRERKFLEHLMELGIVMRLEEVMGCFRAVALRGVIIAGGDENDFDVAVELSDRDAGLGARDPSHADVEEEEIEHARPVDGEQGFAAVKF